MQHIAGAVASDWLAQGDIADVRPIVAERLAAIGADLGEEAMVAEAFAIASQS